MFRGQTTRDLIICSCSPRRYWTTVFVPYVVAMTTSFFPFISPHFYTGHEQHLSGTWKMKIEKKYDWRVRREWKGIRWSFFYMKSKNWETKPKKFLWRFMMAFFDSFDGSPTYKESVPRKAKLRERRLEELKTFIHPTPLPSTFATNFHWWIVTKIESWLTRERENHHA